jgi:hypothetical protein
LEDDCYGVLLSAASKEEDREDDREAAREKQNALKIDIPYALGRDLPYIENEWLYGRKRYVSPKFSGQNT